MAVTADPSYRLLATDYFIQQLKALLQQFEGIRRNDDIECVHQARVASRRLRAGLTMFSDCFSAKQMKIWQKEIKRLTRELGMARDLDVASEYVEGVLQGLTEQQRSYRGGIARLLLRLQQQRHAAQPEVIKVLDRIMSRRVLFEMQVTMEQTRYELKNAHTKKVSPGALRLARRHILKKLRPLLEAQDCLQRPEDINGHHQMRIRAKRLRYTLEICKPLFDKQLDSVYKDVKRVQALLGDIHDCDVWVDLFDDFVKDEEKRTLAYYGHCRYMPLLKVGIDYLKQERQEQRLVLFAEMRDFWQELRERKAWDDLVKLLRQCVEAKPQERREMAEVVKTSRWEGDADARGFD